MLSIVIPTLNEEARLPRLLESIKKEAINNCEIIVADAGSTDKTRTIARAAGCRVVKGGLPAIGRNNGAKAAKGDMILFLDADIETSPNFLMKALFEFDRKKLGIASFPIFPQRKNILLNKATMNFFYNYPQRMLKKIFPMGAMGIMVKKYLFDKVGGFDPEIKLAEDIYFVQKVSEIEKFGVIKSAPLYMPLRRFEKDGYFSTASKFLLCSLYMVAIGPVKKDTFFFRYEFGYGPKEKHKKEAVLSKGKDKKIG